MESAERRALGRVVAYFVLTRLVLLLVAACAIRLVPVGLQAGTERYLPRSLSIGTWLRWDAWWYLSVVERGYWFDPGGQCSGRTPPCSAPTSAAPWRPTKSESGL